MLLLWKVPIKKNTHTIEVTNRAIGRIPPTFKTTRLKQGYQWESLQANVHHCALNKENENELFLHR